MPISVPIVIPVRKAAFYVLVLVVVWDLFGLSLHLWPQERDIQAAALVSLPVANVTVFITKN
jgi:hypothetical protein